MDDLDPLDGSMRCQSEANGSHRHHDDTLARSQGGGRKHRREPTDKQTGEFHSLHYFRMRAARVGAKSHMDRVMRMSNE